MNWYCIHTKPKREAQVAAYCSENLGLETYYPKIQQRRTIRRVRKLVTSSLFPRYLFCRFDMVSYRAVRFAPDVLDLVHIGDKPAVVPERLITELRAWAGDTLDMSALRLDMRPGDAVQIVDGPLRGLPATILRASDDQDRVAVLLSLLQEGAQMIVSRSQLRPAR